MLVDTMSESHDFLFLRQGVFHPGPGSGGGFLEGLFAADADLVERVHHCLVRATVQRTLQCADRGGHR